LSSKVTVLECGHIFCNECWKQYIQIKMKDGSTKLHRMGQKCKVVLTDSFIEMFMDEVSKYNYHKKALESYVNDNKRLRFCPSKPFRGNVIKVITETSLHCIVVHCECGLEFCYKRGLPRHSPASCQMAHKWRSKYEEVHSSLVWMNENTK